MAADTIFRNDNTPSRHKTQNYGYTRTVYIGPRAQEIINPFLKLDLSAYLFDPREAEADRNANRRRNR